MVNFVRILRYFDIKGPTDTYCGIKNTRVHPYFFIAVDKMIVRLLSFWVSVGRALTLIPVSLFPHHVKKHICLSNRSFIRQWKVGFTGIFIIFFITIQKHRLWVLVNTPYWGGFNLSPQSMLGTKSRKIQQFFFRKMPMSKPRNIVLLTTWVTNSFL